MVAPPGRRRRLRWTGAFGLAGAIALLAVPAGTVAAPPEAPSGTLTITAATGSRVEVQRSGAPWEAGALGMQLRPGDRIHTGWKTSITVTFPDGSTATVAPMSLVQIKEISADGKKTLFLTLGEVTVEIQQLPGSRGDFRVITPTTTASVRGTRFSVLYDGSETVVSVIQHRVVVKPRHGRAVVVNQGHEVSSIARSVGRPVAIGRAGARDHALAPAKAIAVLTASISSGIDACQAKAYSVTLAHRPYGWRATVHVQAAPSFDTLWKIAGRRVTAMNSAAKAITAGCAR